MKQGERLAFTPAPCHPVSAETEPQRGDARLVVCTQPKGLWVSLEPGCEVNSSTSQMTQRPQLL